MSHRGITCEINEAAARPSRTLKRRAERTISTPGPTGVEGAGGPGCGARGRQRDQAAAPVGGGGAWPDNEPTRRTTRQHTTPHRCGGRRRPGCGARGRRQGQGGPRERPLQAKLAARTASGRAGRAAAGDLSGQQAARPHAAPHAHGAPAPHANGWGASRHPTRQRPSFNKRSLCRQRLRRADLGGPAAGQPRRDQRGHDGHDAHADQL